MLKDLLDKRVKIVRGEKKERLRRYDSDARQIWEELYKHFEHALPEHLELGFTIEVTEYGQYKLSTENVKRNFSITIGTLCLAAIMSRVMYLAEMEGLQTCAQQVDGGTRYYRWEFTYKPPEEL